MAEISTQDNQKVFNSALQKFKAFAGGVKNVSSTKDMQAIYANMGKLFDAFTKGVLTGQGANSEHVLRTIYKSLNDDFLTIVQDTDAVDKIVEAIKSKQDAVASGTAVQSASETTKKVVSNTLNLDDVDFNQVMLDFLDELQTQVLSVRLALVKEYEKQKAEYATLTLKNQSEDIDKLTGEVSEQGQELVDSLPTLTDEELQWKKEKLDKLGSLVNKFNYSIGSGKDDTSLGISSLEKIVNSYKPVQVKSNFDPEKFVQQLKTRVIIVSDKDAEKKAESIKRQPQIHKPEVKQEQPTVEKPKTGLIPSIEKPKLVPNKKDGKKLATNGTKLDVKPGKGLCVCPICGTQHKPGEHVHSANIDKKEGIKPTKLGKGDSKLSMGKVPTNPLNKQPTQSNKDNKNGQLKPLKNKGPVNDISSGQVSEHLGIIHNNIRNLMRNKKFQGGLIPNYKGIQKTTKKQMKKVDKYESTIHTNLRKTEKGIKGLKRAKKRNKLKSLLLGGITHIAFVLIGGALLIMLARKAFKAWKDKFYPTPDGEGDQMATLFGIPIPGLATLKNIGIALLNTIRVGFANGATTLGVWWKKWRKLLFGKKGMFSTAANTRRTIIKIIAAVIAGHTKKAGGWVISLLGNLIGLIPGWGTVASWIIKLAPLIYSFLVNLITSLWGNHAVDMETHLEDISKNFTRENIKKRLIVAAKGVRLMVPPTAIPGLQTPKPENGGRPAQRGAIMREVTIGANGDNEAMTELQEKKAEEELEDYENNAKKTFKKGKAPKIAEAIARAAGKGGWEWGNYFNVSKNDKAWAEHKNRIKKVFLTTVAQEIANINAYISSLQKSPRFRGVKGVLYDPTTGWNPGYKVYKSDLMTAIPFNPFEQLHKEEDVRFGTLGGGTSSEWLGVMPFTWKQDGITVHANPIQFKIARARRIIKIYEDLYKKLIGSGWGGDFNEDDLRNDLLPKFGKEWKESQYVLYGDYDNLVVNWKDYFTNFLAAFRRGEIDDSNNNFSEETMLKCYDAEWYEKPAVYMMNLQNDIKKWTTGKIKDWRDNFQRATSYDEWESSLAAESKKFEIEKKKDDGVLASVGKWFYNNTVAKVAGAVTYAGKKIYHAYNSYSELQKYKALKVNGSGTTYGQIHDFIIDWKLPAIFQQSTINMPYRIANDLAQQLERSPKVLNFPGGWHGSCLSVFLRNYLSRQGITGFSWDDIKDDKSALAALAQSFLEYFAIRVLPQWDIVQKRLKYTITNKGAGEKDLITDLKKLGTLFEFASMSEHFDKYLRFRNLKTTLVTYSNAKKPEWSRIEKFGMDWGLPAFKNRKAVLEDFAKQPGNTMNASDNKTQLGLWSERALSIKTMYDKAMIEAQYTGDYSFANSLMQQFQNAKSKVEALRQLPADAAYDSSKAANSASKVAGTVEAIAPKPQKTAEEIAKEKAEFEKKEAERKAIEAEKKRKEEEEKKKRAEELAIAKAKIAEMERIKQQEKKYEDVLEKMVATPDKVTDEDFKDLKGEIENIKQEAENRINKLPREEREVKLALIRGDKISPKTFKELKDTAIGLNGNLQDYIKEVNKIPVGSVVSVQNAAAPKPKTIKQIDTDSVDMGD